MTKSVLALSAVLSIAGCGGGGGDAGGGTTPTVPPANAAPTQVALVAVTSQDSSSLAVAWQPAADDKDPATSLRYQLHAGTQADFTPSAATLVYEGTGTTSARIQGLLTGTTYQIRLVALDSAGASTTSAVMAGKTADVPSARIDATTVVVANSNATAPTVASNSLTFANAAAPAAKVGDVLVSDVGAGYLRTVVAQSTGTEATTVQTSPASLTQIFSALELSSRVKLAGAAAQPGGSRVALNANGEATHWETHWAEQGLTISTPIATASPRARALALRTSEPSTLKDGTYGWITGPRSVAVEVGDNVQVPFEARSRHPDVKVCKVEYLDATPRAGGGDPGGLAALGDVAVKSALPGGESTWTVQNFKLTPAAAHALDSDFYVVRARVYLDNAGDDCSAIFNRYKEKIDFEFNLAVTKPGEALPTSTTSKVVWDGEFKVTNTVDFNFDPVFDTSLKISGAKLQSAVTKVKGALGMTQTLTVDASGSGTLTPQIKVLTPERTFRKVFLVGQVPVLISGSFVLKGKVEGNVTGKMNVTETFDYGFPDFEFGIQYLNGEWVPIKQMNPAYKLVIKGSGEAQANLSVSVIPEFKISAYEAATARITVEPKVTAKAAIEGHFLFQDTDGSLLSDADYRFTAMDVLGEVKAYVMADFTVFDHSFAVWPEPAKPDDYTTWRTYQPIAETKILGLPELSAAVDVHQRSAGNAKSALVTVKAIAVPNPLNVVDHAPIIEFGNWLKAYAVQPTQGLQIESVEDGGTSDTLKLWVSYITPGHYTVRVPAQSMLKLRQYIDVEFDIPDDNNDGIADPWAQRYGITSAAADPDHDGMSNLSEFQQNTDPLVASVVPVIKAESDSVSLGQRLLLWIENAYVAAKTAIWQVGDGAASAAVAVGDGFTAMFDKVGITAVIATLRDAAGAVLGTVEKAISVQALPGPSVTGVTPPTAVAGVAKTFTVSGALLPAGLSFQLLDCANVSEVLAGGSATQRQFTCTFPPGTSGVRQGAVALSSSPFGTVMHEFSVVVSPATVGAISPAAAIRSLASSFDIAGQNLPTSGLTVAPVLRGGDTRSHCQAPNNLRADGLNVACELYTLGDQTLEVRSGSEVLGSVVVRVDTNVTGVTWTSPSTTSSGTVKFGETVTFTVAGVNLKADMPMGFAVENCGVSNTEIGAPTDTARTFQCNFNDQAGAVAGNMPGVVKDGYNGQVLLSGWSVPVAVAAPPATSPSANLLLGGTFTDSCSFCPATAADALTNGNLDDGRNLLTYSGSFNIFVGSPIALDHLILYPYMTPNGNVSYEIQTSTSPTGAAGTWTSHGRRSGAMRNETPFPIALGATARDVRVVKVIIHSSPSWVAFSEIEGYLGAPPNIFYDNFRLSAPDPEKWAPDGTGPVSITAGLAQFGAFGRISTNGKVTFSGAKMVIEARMAGTGSGRDTSILLKDVANAANVIYSGDTNYCGWGLHASAAGIFEITSGAFECGGTIKVRHVGASTNQFMEYRWTIDGDRMTVERGPTLTSITETMTLNLGQSIAGRSFVLSIGTASAAYSPGTWDWVRVSTW